MNSKNRKPLEVWQREDAARLKALFQQRSKLSQDAFGAEYNLGTQGMVWQYINGHTPLNLGAVIKFARGLGVDVIDISPTLAQQLGNTNQSTATALGAIIQGLPEADRKLTLDFIEYRIERASPQLAKEQFAHYKNMLINIKKAREQAADDDAMPKADQAG